LLPQARPEARARGAGVCLREDLLDERNTSWTVLHVVAPGQTGGLERVIHGLAVGHRAMGIDAHVAAVIEPEAAGRPHAFLDALRGNGVPVHEVAVGGRAYLTERRRIGALIDALGPVIVHTHGFRPDVVDGGVARRRVPVVSTVHGFTGVDWKTRLYERLQARALRRFDAVVAVSEPIARGLLMAGIHAARLSVIRNAWLPAVQPLDRPSAEDLLGIADLGRPRVGWVGRLSPEKAPSALLDALARPRCRHVSAVLVGDGPERPAVEARIDHLGLRDRVRLVGMVPDAQRALAAFDALVLSSRTEGTPMVLFEAMGACLPVVATRVGGIPDVVSEREAVLVDPGMTDALADAIAHALGDAERARDRARAARARLEAEFGGGPWLRAYAGLYERLDGATA
jgi:glycosyltransferase involved in cell wall biosynthesis